MTRAGFYAVAKGRQVGIFTSWEDGAEPQVTGFSGAKHKKFPLKPLAEAYLLKNRESVPSVYTQEDEEDDDKENLSDVLPKLNALSMAASEPIASECHEQEDTAMTERPDPRDQDTLVAFCGGSGPSNGKPDCRGGYAAVFPHCPACYVAKKIEKGDRATNERAYCYAVLEAMKHANKENPKQNQALFIFTNRLNVIKSMTKWIGEWRKNGWLTAKKEPVKNRDLFEKLWAAQGERRIVWARINTNKMSPWEKEWSVQAGRAAREAARGSP